MRKKKCGDCLLGYDLLQPSRLDNMLTAQSGLGLAHLMVVPPPLNNFISLSR